jgi:hypothetical protein
VRRHAALLLLGVGALLLSPGAAGVPDVPGDPTPPVVIPEVTGTLGSAGWYVSNVTVRWRIQDPESEILETQGCDIRTLTGDTGGTTLTCKAITDVAEATVSSTFRIDKTAPTLVPDPDPDPNAAGWHRQPLTIHFPGIDTTSGIASCSADRSYNTGETAGTPIAGFCTDRAGNRTDRTYNVKYDTVAPTLVPDPVPDPNAGGWHRQSLTITFPGSDGTSGIASCTADRPYSTPDTTGTPIAGSCTDNAGNRTDATYDLKYDTVAPGLVPDPVPDPNADGWHRQPLTIKFPGTDGTSGIASCTADRTYSTPDTTSTPIAGFCTDRAGNRTDRTYTVRYDATAPTLAADAVPDPNASGWHRQPLTIKFPGTDGTSGIATCTADRSYSTPDTGGTPIAGFCTDKAGNRTDASYSLKYDATAPQVTSESPSRPANANGWYSQELSVTFAGTDLTSGIAGCDSPSYSGPDGTLVVVSGRCRDNAGNESAARPFAFNYDATPPSLVPDPESDPNAEGWHRQPLTIRFPGTDATSGIAGCTADRPYGSPDTASTPIAGSCTDRAGNRTDRTYTLKYDATAPTLTPDPVPDPNAAGWHRQPLTIRFPGTDATSGIAACTADRDYSTPETTGSPIGGFCTDRAGNRTDRTYDLKYDATPPQLTPAALRGPEVNGWYNRELTIRFPGTDVVSGIATCTPEQRYSTPDSATASVTGSCTDRAGNTTERTFGFQYDATPPQLIPAALREPDVNGWYNRELTIRFPGTDATSGIETCAPNRAYSTPDSRTASVQGSCTDKAGNTTTRAFGFQYDGTPPELPPAPSREPDQNGWYNHELTVRFPGTDATAGIATCTADRLYSTPDSAAASVPGLCTDQAGNTTTKAFGFKYDGTGPLVTGAAPERPPEPSGWYVEPVTFGFTGSDGLAGIDVCPELDYDGPDGVAVSVTGTCLDKAGNVGTGTFPLRYDDTGPAVSAVANREPDVNGWYNRSLTVRFAGSDEASGVALCVPPQGYDGPDAVFAVVTGTCLDNAGNVGLGSLALKYDATAPQVAGGTPDRAPDGNGWYSGPLTVSFHGSDATSDIGACTVSRYVGPDNPSASVAGSCTDRAGNSSGPGMFTFKYDTTAPSIADLKVKAGNRSAALTWNVSPDTSFVEVVRTAGARGSGVAVYRGTGRSFTDTRLVNGVRYRYRLSGFDEAGNAATREVAATPTGPLRSPQAGATVSSPPRLGWMARRGAMYYNVQVWRGRKIFSAWPTGTSLQLPRAWTYRGRRYRLSPGRYRWYVWPGLGRRSEKRFGRLLGSSSFVVR